MALQAHFFLKLKMSKSSVSFKSASRCGVAFKSMLRVVAGLRLVLGHSWKSNHQHVPAWHYFQAKRRPYLDDLVPENPPSDVDASTQVPGHTVEAEIVPTNVVETDSKSNHDVNVVSHDETGPSISLEASLPEPREESVVQKVATQSSVFADLRRDGQLDSVPLPKLSEKARERNVPASPLGRVVAFSGLAFNLGFGAASETIRRAMGGEAIGSSVFVSERNAQVLVDALCKMRGAALKLGQFLSIQDEGVVPKARKKVAFVCFCLDQLSLFQELVQIFDRVRQDADVMPARKVEEIVSQELGSDWRLRVLSFDEKPIAAASIGQVEEKNIFVFLCVLLRLKMRFTSLCWRMGRLV
jgi:hypothetical protein